jgi:hypothetical protein
MKITTVLSAIGGGAQAISGACSAAIIVGGIYLIDCRISARGADQVDRCYFTALPLMGVGIAGRGGFSVGYNTLNPALRKEEEPKAGGLLGGRR